MLRLGVVASSNYVPWPIVMFTYAEHYRCQQHGVIDELIVIVACELKKRNLYIVWYIELTILSYGGFMTMSKKPVPKRPI